MGAMQGNAADMERDTVTNSEDMATAQTNIPVDENVPENTVGELENANKYKNGAFVYDETSREIRLEYRPSKGTLEEPISSDNEVKKEKEPWKPIPRNPDTDIWEHLKPIKREDLIPIKPTSPTPDLAISSTNAWPQLSSVNERAPNSVLTEPTPALAPSPALQLRQQKRNKRGQKKRKDLQESSDLMKTNETIRFK